MGKARIPEMEKKIEELEKWVRAGEEEKFKLQNCLEIVRRLLESVIRELEGK